MITLLADDPEITGIPVLDNGEAADGFEALQLIETTRPDTVLMDVQP